VGEKDGVERIERTGKVTEGGGVTSAPITGPRGVALHRTCFKHDDDVGDCLF
jgi:hypothetical protein